MNKKDIIEPYAIQIVDIINENIDLIRCGVCDYPMQIELPNYDHITTQMFLSTYPFVLCRTIFASDMLMDSKKILVLYNAEIAHTIIVGVLHKMDDVYKMPFRKLHRSSGVFK